MCACLDILATVACRSCNFHVNELTSVSMVYAIEVSVWPCISVSSESENTACCIRTAPIIVIPQCLCFSFYGLFVAILFYNPGDNVFVTTDHMGEPMPLNKVVQTLQVTLTEYSVKIQEQSKVRQY